MKLTSIRDLNGMKPVLQDPESFGPDSVYWVFSDLGDRNKWYNTTLITPGRYHKEFPKTFGHYHPVGASDETYHLVEGEGILMMQQKHLEGDTFVPQVVDAVYLIKAEPGDEIVIKPQWGHSWSNIGQTPLISFDDWRSGHTPADYEPIMRMRGMAYYLVEDNGQVLPMPNPQYKGLPRPIWITAHEFRALNI